MDELTARRKVLELGGVAQCRHCGHAKLFHFPRYAPLRIHPGGTVIVDDSKGWSDECAQFEAIGANNACIP